MSPRKRLKSLSAAKLTKLRARAQVGPPRPTVQVESRKDRPAKHKKRELEQEEPA